MQLEMSLSTLAEWNGDKIIDCVHVANDWTDFEV